MLLNRSGTDVLDAPPILPWSDDWPPSGLLPWSPPRPPALLGGRGLFRMSFRVDEEDEGVRTGDWLAASLDEPREDGDAVPSLESLFFLDDLLGSLPRES